MAVLPLAIVAGDSVSHPAAARAALAGTTECFEVADMIRETVTCDICGVHKFEANHWFMVVENKGSLKISPWGVPNSMRPQMKHLCGQKCVHRFVDDFLAGHPGGTAASAATEVAASAAGDESSAKLLTISGPRSS